AESVALAEGTLEDGLVLIGFEGNDRIGRFRMTEAGPSAPLHYVDLPPEARRMGSNGGFEAISVLKSGRPEGSMIAFAERLLDEHGNHTGWVWVNGKPQVLHLVDIGGVGITEAPGLEYGGLSIRLTRLRWAGGVQVGVRVVPGAEG